MEGCNHSNITIDDDIRVRGNTIKFGVWCADCNTRTKDSWQFISFDGMEFEWEESEQKDDYDPEWDDGDE